jgi:hypothetical protein
VSNIQREKEPSASLMYVIGLFPQPSSHLFASPHISLAIPIGNPTLLLSNPETPALFFDVGSIAPIVLNAL